MPVQPGAPGGKCSWLKTANPNDMVAAFVHRTRCNSKLTATVVESPKKKNYKFCKDVGDAYYTVLPATAPANASSWAGCKAACDAEPDCAACQTDGQACKLLTTYTSGVCGATPPGCDAWFKIF